MRGKELLAADDLQTLRITPACAGKRRRTFAPNVCQGDHPRVCGEKSKLFPVDDAVKGSPPRVRGKVKVGLFVGHSVRITPACAGKRQTGLTLMLWSGDHPCVCGEKALKSWLMSGDVGSPPRMRGKVTLGNHHAFLFRITPRVCGEKCGYRLPFRSIVGSPPRVRGKGQAVPQVVTLAGITPACAGKSCRMGG